MITIYELKHKRCCRSFMRTPFYIKNFILLCIMSCILFSVYLVYFRKDGMVVQNIVKILKGLNSGTFNYLESNSESLRLTKLLNNYPTQMSTNSFIDDCMRINKPCKFESMAKNWHAYEKWRLAYGGHKYLQEQLDEQVTVYIDIDSDINIGVASGNSFKNDFITKMPYTEFLDKMNTNSIGVAMKDSDIVNKKLLKDISNPDFMNDIADPESIELIQGQVIVNPAHYEKNEQFVCAIDGYVQIKLVPHVFRQEVYAGQHKLSGNIESERGVLGVEELTPN